MTRYPLHDPTPVRAEDAGASAMPRPNGGLFPALRPLAVIAGVTVLSIVGSFLVISAIVAAATPAKAGPLPAGSILAPEHTCLAVAAAVERREGLPANLLGAISLRETGRWNDTEKASFAWPWTVMAEGRGRYLPSRDAAIREVQALKARGIRNIDVGCMQINLIYHGDAFDSLEQAFEPAENAGYAAEFLKDLRRRHGNWQEAVEHYHSADPERGARYRAAVDGLKSRVANAPQPRAAATLTLASTDQQEPKKFLYPGAPIAHPEPPPSPLTQAVRDNAAAFRAAMGAEQKAAAAFRAGLAKAAADRVNDMQSRQNAEFEAKKAKFLAEWDAKMAARKKAKARR